MPISDNSEKVAVVILSWDGAKLLRNCLEALKRQSCTDFYVILVDNGSVDETAELPGLFADDLSIMYLKNDRNLGYARGSNIGISEALNRSAKYIVLLNNDTKPEKDWLAELVRYMDNNPETGMAQGLNYISTEGPGQYTFDSNGIYLEEGFIPRQRSSGTTSLDNSTPILGPNAAGAILRASLVKDITYKGAFFDESFFAYVEDVDMLFRSFWRGWDSAYVEDARLQHVGSATGNRIAVKKMYWGARNNIRLITKNVPATIIREKARIIIRSQIANLVYLVKIDKRLLAAYFAGVCVGILQIPLYLNKRRNIMKGRRRSDADLKSLLVPSKPPIGNPFRALGRRIFGR